MKRMKKMLKKLGARLSAVKAVMSEPFFEVVTLNVEGIGMQGYTHPRVHKAISEALDDVRIEIMREVERMEG